MKSKSLLNFKPGAESFFDICARRGLKYGSILAESYWKRDSAGYIVQSEPLTDQILSALFYPFTALIGADNSVKIGRYFTGLKIEYITGPGRVNIERITFKPPAAAAEQTPDFIRSELVQNFKQHHAAND